MTGARRGSRRLGLWRGALALALALAGPAAAAEHGALARAALDGAILPAADSFAQATAGLASRDCADPGLTDAYHGTFDTWMALAPYGFGPLEVAQRAQQIAFWPDAKGNIDRELTRLIAARDPAVLAPATFARQSIAARGLMALERLLTAPDPLTGYRCALARAITTDLARLGAEIAADWHGAAGAALATAGAPGNTTYRSPDEATRRLLVGLNGALEQTRALRLERVLGTLDRPWGSRAEAWRSGRSLRNIAGILAATRRLHETALGPALPGEARAAMTAALAYADHSLAAALAGPPLDQAVAGPGRFKIEVLQAAIAALIAALTDQVAPALGITPGFNAADGD